MTSDVANILLGYISPLPFFDKFTGLVKTVSYRERVEENRFVSRSFPVGCDVTYDQCQSDPQKLIDLIPNTRYKSVHYFEQLGMVRFIDNTFGYNNYEVSLRLVGWLNLPKLGKKNECSVSSVAVQNIIRELPVRRFNSSPYTKIYVQSVSEVQKDARIFNSYTYDEATVQYLMHPFDYYALDMTVRFSVHQSCVPDLIPEPPQC